jgi:hypothetical protein
MTLLQSYAGDKQQLSKTMTMKIYVILGKAKPNTGNINGSNLAAVKLTIAPVFELPQYNITMICCTEPGLTKACENLIYICVYVCV